MAWQEVLSKGAADSMDERVEGQHVGALVGAVVFEAEEEGQVSMRKTWRKIHNSERTANWRS